MYGEVMATPQTRHVVMVGRAKLLLMGDSSDAANPAYAYETVAEHIAGSIAAGQYPPGKRLPSLRDLANTHGVSQRTVIHAIRVLADRGLIEARDRSGYYVAGGVQVVDITDVNQRLDSHDQRLAAIEARLDRLEDH